jgi:hypothetical protein
MKTDNYIYAAGFVDGAGCISTSGTTGFRVTITSTDRDVLNWMRATFGGNINEQHRPENPNWSASWKWIVSSKPDVSRFLQAIYPYLKTKKEQAKIVLNYLEKYPVNKTGRQIPDSELDAFAVTKTLIQQLKQRKL